MACSSSSSFSNSIHDKPIEEATPREDEDHDNVFDDSLNIAPITNTVDTTATEGSYEKPFSTKVHTVTVCVVPPSDHERVWEVVSDMRRTLQDPGYFRWPPHINLLYPFLKLPSSSSIAMGHENEMTLVADIVQQLELATTHVPPFETKLDSFGIFGGANRGVLWLHPESSSGLLCDENNYEDDIAAQNKIDLCHRTTNAPLIALQQSLEDAFPMCCDQSRKGEYGKFVPHMTISHFSSRDEALQGQYKVEAFLNPNDLQFLVDRIYLLERKGDDGQFLRVAEIALGGQNHDVSAAQPTMRAVTKIFDPPLEFPGMPDKEEEWVYDGRMKLKEQRRSGYRSRGGGRGRRKFWNRITRVPDTPDIIAAKRAERKSKRESLLSSESQQNPRG
jgi:2'-5' RNA ligase